MRRMVVIGIGCILMRDDGIGVRVAECIKEELSIENIEVIIAETDFEFGLSAIHDGDFVIVLDAIYTGKNYQAPVRRKAKYVPEYLKTSPDCMDNPGV